MLNRFSGAAARAAAVLFVASLLSLPALAVTKTWTNNNGSGDGRWLTATNWSPAGVPTSADAVEIGVTDQSSNYCMIDGAAVAGSITLGNAFTNNPTLEIKNGSTLTISGASTTAAGTTLYVNNGNLTGAGSLTAGGTINLNGGQITGSGGLTINSGASLNFQGGVNFCYLGRNTTNNGSIVFSSSAWDHYLLTSAVITNNGLINFLGDESLWISGAGPFRIDNQATGIVRKSGGTGTTGIKCALNNAAGGSIESDSGTLSIDAGGGSVGAFDAASGTTIAITSATYTLSSGATVTGAGKLVLGSTLTIASGADVTIPNLQMTSSISVVNGSGTLRIGTNLDWDAGSMSGGGLTILQGTATMSMDCSSYYCYLDNRQLNLGTGSTSTFTPTVFSFYLQNGATFHVNTGATFEIQTDFDINNGGGAASTFSNSGTVQKTAGTAATFFGVPVTSSGTFSVTQGDLQFSAGATITGGTINTGTTSNFDVTGGVFSFNAAATISGSGAFRVTGGTLRIPTGVTQAIPRLTFSGGSVIDGGGTLQLQGISTWSGGVMGSSSASGGTTEVVSGATLNMTGTSFYLYLDHNRQLVNNGTVNHNAAPYNLYLYNGSDIVNNGVFDLQNDSSIHASGTGPRVFTNNGTLTKSGGTAAGGAYLYVELDNPATGTINVTSGRLNLQGGGTSSGTFTIGSGAFIQITGDYDFAGTPTVTGLGTLRVSGGNLIVPAAVTLTVPQLQFDTGYISGAGTLKISDTSYWNGGTMGHGTYPGGITEILPGGELYITCSTDNASLANSRILRNNDLIHYTAAVNGIWMYTGSQIQNAATFNYNSDRPIGISGSGMLIDNDGLIYRSTGTGAAVVNVPLDNNGTIQVESGSLLLAGNGTHTGGSFTANGTASVGFSGGTHSVCAACSLTGTGTIVFSGANVTVAGSYNPARTTINAGTATFNSNSSTGVLTLGPYATLAGSGTFTITDDSTWSGGYMSGSGTTVVSAGKTLTISATGHYCYLDARTLTNNGTIQYTPNAGNYYLYLQGNGTFNNAGQFNLTGDQMISSNGTGTFNNSGTLTKSGGTATSAISVTLHNTGTVSAPTGTLALNGNGTHTGNFVAGGTIAFSGGTQTMSGPGTISGAGTLAFTGGTSTITAAYSVGALKITGGTAIFNVSGDANTLELSGGGTLSGSGTFTANNGGSWSGGTMSGSGQTIIPALQTFTITASTNYCSLEGRTLTNNGSITYNPAPYYLQIYNSGLLTNAGSFAIVADQYIHGFSGGTFTNSGTLTKTTTAGTTNLTAIFNNNGTVTLSTGMLTLGGGGTSTGSWTVNSPATLNFNGGTHSISGAGSIGGTGTLAVSGATVTSSIPYAVGTLSVSSGTVTFNANGSADAFTLTGGQLGGSGTFTANNGGTWSGGDMTGTGNTIIPAGKTLAINAINYLTLHTRTLTNSGSITYTSPGAGYLQLSNNATLNNAGTFTINGSSYLWASSSGTLNNSGTLAKAGGAHIDVAVVVNNTGQITVTAGTLSMQGGGTHTNGVFTATSPGAIQFSGNTHTIAGTGSLGGTGTYIFSGGTAVVAVPYTIATLNIANGTATFNTNGTATVLNFTNGTLNGTGTITITDNSTWAGGAMSGTGTTVFSAGKTCTLGSSNYLTIDTRTVTNNGTMNYVAPNYYLNISNSGVLNNAGTFNVQTDLYVYGSNNGTINNTGTFSRTSGTNNSTDVYAHFHNNGTVVVSKGSLTFRGNGTHNGTFTATSPGAIAFAGGTHSLTAASTLGGNGIHRFNGGIVTVNGTWGGSSIEVGGGTATFNTSATISSLTFTNGTIDGSGNITVTGNSTWSGGTMDGSGTTVFGSGATVTMNGTTYYITISRPLQNLGTINYSATIYYLQIEGVTITNDGVFDIQTSQVIYAYGTSPQWQNNGTLKKTAGTGTMQFHPPLTNVGAVQVGSGTMYFSGTYTQTTGTTELLNNATLQTATLNIDGGSLIGNGTIAGHVVSDMSVSPGPVLGAGTISITGNYTQTGTGSLNIDLGGTTAGTQYDRLLVGGSVSLAGDLNVSTINGFLPASGNAFQVLTFGSRPGPTDFTNKNGLSLGSGTNLVPAYSATDLQLTTNTVQTDLQASMTASPTSVSNGGAISYTVTVTNNGGSNASGVVFTGTLPANVAFTGSVPAICTNPPNLTCSFGNIPNGGNASVTINVTANGTGTATFSGNASGSQFDPNGANNSASASATISATADLNVTVTSSPTTVAAGAPVNYVINVTNQGANTANSVSLTVATPASLTFNSATGVCANGFPCALGNIAPGATVSITASYTVSPTATGTAQLTATAAATSPADPDASDDSATATTTIAQDADVQVVKTGPTNVPAESGSTVTYTLTVTNNGPSNASSVVLDDPTPSGLTLNSVTGDCTSFPCTIGTMTVGQTKTTQVTYAISGAVGTTFTNTATVTSGADNNANNNSSSVTTTVSNCPSTTISAPSTVNGNSTGNTASVTAITGATYSWSISNGTITAGQGTTAVTFTAGATGSVTLSVSVASGSCTSNPSTTITVIDADVVVTKSGPANVSPATSSQITYTINVVNNGPSAAANVALTDPTPSGLTFVSATGACTSFPCALGNMAAGASLSAQVTYSFTNNAPQSVTNVATASSSTPDRNPANNSGSAVTNIGSCPATSIAAPSSVNGSSTGNTASVTAVTGATYSWSISNGTITAGQGTASITFTAGATGSVTLSVTVTSGSCTSNPSATITVVDADVVVTKTGPANVSPATASQITYTINVANNGPSAAANVTVTDPTPSGLTFVSATGACTSFPCALGNMAAGASLSAQVTYGFTAGPQAVTNVATATSSTPDRNPSNNSGSAVTNIAACPTATISGPSALEPGAASSASTGVVTGATYAWSISNGTITGGQGTNAINFTAGALGTTTLTVTVTAGQCTSTATHSVNVTSSQADAGIGKSAPSSVASGAQFAYTLTVSNNGPGNAESVVVTDSLPNGVTLVSATGTCTGTSTITCSAGTLAPGASQSITITVTAPTGPVTLTNTASVSTTTADPNAVNNSSTVTTTVQPPQGLCPAVVPALHAPDDAIHVTSPVTFSWSLVQHATFYELWLGANEQDLAVHETTTGSTLGVSLAPGTYAWKVVARGDASCAPRSSNVRTFTIPTVNTCANNGTATPLSPVGTTVSSPVTFSWSGTANAIGYVVRYRVDGGALQEAGSTTGATSLTAPVPPGAISWVVDSLFSDCPMTRSAAAQFTVQQPANCEGNATLTAPANNSSTTNAVVTFGWSGVTGATEYRLWMQSGSAAADVIGSTNTTSLTRTVATGTHTWWVETILRGCPSRESQRFTFTITAAQNCEGRGRPALVAPAGGATTSTANVNFSWTAVTGAIGYELLLVQAAGVPTVVETTPLTSASAEVPSGTVQWFVRALFNGCPATESDHRTLTYEPPPNCVANARPLLISPDEGERIASPVSFDWNDVAGATSYELYVAHGNQEPSLVTTTTVSQASGINRELGAGRWFVRARFAAGCAALDSTESRFVVVPQAAACSPLDAPVVSAPGQISSGANARVQWSFVPGAVGYILETSTDPNFSAGATTSSDMGAARQQTFSLDNDGREVVEHYIRVRAIDTRCNPRNDGPFSDTAVVYVLPKAGDEGSALIGDAADVEYTLTLGSEFAGQPFTATPTTSWLTVTPASGTVPAGGLTLTVTARTAGLPPGTNIGGITITTGSASRIGTQGTTTVTMPVSVNLVSPVTPTPKNTPPPDALVIPAVANADGIGSHFQSDVRVSNTGAQVMKYQLSFTPTGDAGSAAGKQTTFSIEPGRTVALDDILKTWFGTGTSNAIGTLEVRPLTEVSKSTTSGPVTGLPNLVTFASSRTFNVTPNGTFGQYIPAIPFASFIGKDKVLSLQQIAHSQKYRTNLGLVEGSGEPAELLVKVFGATGTELAQFPVSLKGGQHTQLNGFLSQHGVTSLDDGRVEVAVTSGNGKVTAYASVLDNATADPLLVSPVTLGSDGNTRWVVPGVADLNNGAANWQTDMRVFNAGSTPEELTLSFYSMNGGEPKTSTITLQPGEVRQFDKLLANTFGVTQNGGAVHITSADSARLIATARTYNLTTQGTYGQFISAVTPSEAVGVGSRPLQLLQVEESPRYRSNIGLAEVSGKPVTLEVSIVPPDAKFTATVRVDLAPNEFRQITSMLASLGLGDTYNARVTVRAVTGEGRATAYASVIDAKTNDPTYVPAQ